MFINMLFPKCLCVFCPFGKRLGRLSFSFTHIKYDAILCCMCHGKSNELCKYNTDCGLQNFVVIVDISFLGHNSERRG